MKRIIYVWLFVTAVNSAFAQKWVNMMDDPNANFYQVQKEFEKYWEGKTIDKGKGWKAFKRWEYFMEPRVYPSGNFLDPSLAFREYEKYMKENEMSVAATRAPQWSFVGPKVVPSNGGAGRINCIRFDPKNSSIIYAGAPDGGLWKSTDGGSTWSTNTDKLPALGVSDLAIDPNDTQIMYLATGDNDAGDAYSLGILKSTDGGTTWNTTGLNWELHQIRRIGRILMNPNDTKILIAATSNGMYRSTDAGVSWSRTQAGNFKDAELKPDDPNTIYASGTGFCKSTDGGVTFTTITSGLPTTGVRRMAIAVTPADPNYVYILAAKGSDYGFEGIYRSTNSGTDFTQRSNSPNILGWQANGSDAGGQGWYDLAIAVSPTNKELVICGGVNIWKSSNGGTSWTIHGHWTGSGAPYVHADIHDLVFLPGSSTTYFAGSDGGVFKTSNSGSAWSDISEGLAIAQIYSIGLSASTSNLHIGGWQDNGTNRYNGTSWSRVIGGDGMVAFIDWSNNNYMYGELYYGDFRRSSNGGTSFTTIAKPSTTEKGAWVTPWLQDPKTAATLYAGYQNVYKSTNRGDSWTKISNFNLAANDRVISIAVAPSDPQYIYAINSYSGVSPSTRIFKTTNGGTSWTEITGTLPVGSSALTNVAVDYTSPDKIWVTFSGFVSTNKVFHSTDGGTNWINISGGLPNIPVTIATPEKDGAQDALYIGTDVGVYYRNKNTGGWIPFNNGLPNVRITDVEIFYGSPKKVRVATYGRGVWECDVFDSNSGVAPLAAFTNNIAVGCPAVSVQFTDQSGGVPTSWKWTFDGGTPSTSSIQNPLVVYNTPGTYDVTLIATNANGADTILRKNQVLVLPALSNPVTMDDTVCAPGGTVKLSASGASGASFDWYDAASGGNKLNTGATYSPYINKTTVYYVEAVSNKPLQKVGSVDSAQGGAGGGYFKGNDIRGLLFNAMVPVKLKSIKVYANSDGERTFQVLSGIRGNILQTKTVNVPKGESRVNLDFEIPQGNDYFLKVTGVLIDLYRNSGTANFPYTVPGLISITESDVSQDANNASFKNYYYFYDWEVQEFACSSNRVAVNGIVEVCSGLDEQSTNQNNISIYPNPTNDEFTVMLQIKHQDTYTLEIKNTLGQVIYKEIIPNHVKALTKTFDLRGYGRGMYMISIRNSHTEHAVNKKVFVY